MKTVTEVLEWCAGAEAEFGDPSVPICQLFFRWQDDLKAYGGDELACGRVDGEFALWLRPDLVIPMPIEMGRCRIDAAFGLEAYGADRITAGVWAINPSLNVEGLIHGFVTLHGVPDPAPWERKIMLLEINS